MVSNRKTMLVLVVVAFGMLGLGFASKPLYDTFCKVTGFGGTPRIADANTSEIIDRVIKINFDSNVSNGLPWDFEPIDRSLEVKVGQTAIAYYKVKNVSNETIIGTATYNVTPIKAAPYFIKTECFCFTEQRIEPGQEVDMPVLFHVDSQIQDDDRMDDVKDITLSYTFFRVEQPAAQSRDALN